MSPPKECPLVLPFKINWRIGKKFESDESEGIRSFNM
jgi:hypothetical protein